MKSFNHTCIIADLNFHFVRAYRHHLTYYCVVCDLAVNMNEFIGLMELLIYECIMTKVGKYNDDE